MKKINYKLPKAFVIYFGIFLLIVTIVIIIYFKSYYLMYISQVKNELKQNTEIKVRAIEEWRTERIKDANIFYNNKHVQDIVYKYITDTTDYTSRKYIFNVFDYIVNNNEYYKILLLDSTGKERLSYKSKFSKKVSNHIHHINEVKASNNIYFKDFSIDDKNSPNHIELYVPIFHDNKFFAAFELCINPENYLLDIIKFNQIKTKSLETFIIKKDGDSLLYLSNLLFHSSQKYRIPLTNKQVCGVKVLLGHEGELEGLNYSGEEVYSYAKHVDGTPWYILTNINKDEVDSNVYERFFEIIVFVIVALFSLIISFYLIWRKQKYNYYKQNFQSVKALLESEKRYKALFEGSYEGIVFHDLKGTIFEINLKYASTHGYTVNELIGKNVYDLNTIESKKEVVNRLKIVKNNKNLTFETVHIKKDGSLLPLEIVSTCIKINDTDMIISFQRDISERKNNENKIQKLFRINSFISNINKIIVRVKSVDDLYKSVCKVAVEVAKFKMVWVGILNNKTKDVEVVASAGETGNYINNLKINLNDCNRSNGMTGKAFKTGFYAFTNNLQNDSYMSPWANDAKLMNFNSSIALPIIVDDITIGTINLYSEELNFFNQDEINLLIEVSNDISYSVEQLINEEKHKLTKLELQKSEKKYQLIAENSSDIIWIVDINTLMLNYISPSVTNVLGYSVDEISKLTMDKYFTSDSFNYLMSELNQLLELESKKELPLDLVKTFEVQEFCKDGKIIDVEIKAHFLREEKTNKIYAIQGTTSDITFRKIAVKKLIESETRYKTLVELLSDGVIVHCEGKVVFANKIACKILKFSSIENIINSNVINYVHPDYKDLASKRISKAFKTNEPPPLLEEKLICFDGSIVDVEVSANPIIFDNKQSMLVVFKDITKRKLLTEELIESKTLFETLTNVSQVGIFRTDANGLTTFVNPKWQELSGISFKQALGNGWLNSVHPEDKEKIINEWNLSVKSGKHTTVEYRFLKNNNTEVWVIGTAVPYYKNEVLQGYIGAITDISVLKKAEENQLKINELLEKEVEARTLQLQIRNKELESFNYAISHDLKSPLNLIKGYIKILKSRYGESFDEDGLKTLNVIVENSNNMEKMILSLLNISRTTLSKLRLIEVEMDKIVNIVIDDIFKSENKENISLNINKLHNVTVDPELIKHVWTNLIANAVKFTISKQDRIIEIGSLVENNNILYFVKDNGVGFNTEYSDKLFKPFSRLHKSDEFEGTGIGLTIVELIIKKHGGKVWAESKINEGSTFWFSLPIIN